MTTYANQIQVLTLRNAELEAHNASLLERMRHSGENVAVVPALILAGRLTHGLDRYD